jgi:hypothetical protein
MATKLVAQPAIARRAVASRAGSSAPQFAPAAWHFIGVLFVFGLAYATFELAGE